MSSRKTGESPAALHVSRRAQNKEGAFCLGSPKVDTKDKSEGNKPHCRLRRQRRPPRRAE